MCRKDCVVFKVVTVGINRKILVLVHAYLVALCLALCISNAQEPLIKNTSTDVDDDDIVYSFVVKHIHSWLRVVIREIVILVSRT